MNCGSVRPFLQAFVDDELSPERCIEIDGHLAQCSECQAAVDLTRTLCRATRITISQYPVCPDIHARLVNCLKSERARSDGHSFDPLSWRIIAPLAAAAVMTLFLSAKVPGSAPDGAETAAKQASSVRTASFPNSSSMDNQVSELGETSQVLQASSAQDNSVMDFLIRHHAARYEPEVIEPGSVNGMERHLGFRVRTPDFRRYGAHFEGANLVPVNRTRAAVLHYNLGGKRVTVYMYNPEELSLRSYRSLTPRVVGNHAIFVGHRRGYSIATCERDGVGYAVTTDLSGEESAELVAALDL